jgi:putative two-component system response regulator
MQRFDLNIKLASILVVDDEPVNVRLLEKILAAEGHTNIISTIDPREVANLYQEHQIDLILLDINMPHLDGFEVMAQLKAQHGHDLAPILVLTAQNAQEFRIKALQSGARDYVTKPFDRYELAVRVRNLLEVQLAHKCLIDQNSLLEERILERTRQLHDTRLQVVRRLGRAAEYRDNETGMHILRMSKISALLGREIGLDGYQCELLLHASPMHDIGKIGIPDQILLKPGKLDPDEWEIMKRHAQIGADILSGDDSEMMAMACEIALTHHEKWDGSGYPHGYSGEQIPLVGRIVAVADVFDALTSVRPYKKAWPVEEAVELLQKESGRHFQPLLVEQFLANLPEILEIKAAHAEPDES